MSKVAQLCHFGMEILALPEEDLIILTVGFFIFMPRVLVWASHAPGQPLKETTSKKLVGGTLETRDAAVPESRENTPLVPCATRFLHCPDGDSGK